MTGARRGLAVTTAALLGLGAAAAWYVPTDGARRGAVRLLRADTHLAARLWREPNGPAAARAVFGERISVAPATDADVEDVTVSRDARGLVGRAPLYDEDDWDVTGLIEVRASPVPADIPGWSWAALLVALACLGPLAWRWTNPRLRTRRRDIGVAALVVAAAPGVVAAAWARDTLATATDRRIDTAAAGLRALDNLEEVVARPGGVRQLTGLDFIADRDAEPGFSSLPPRPAAEIAASETDGPIVADRMRYLTRDVGRVRLVTIPFGHTLWRWLPALAVLVTAYGLACMAAGLTGQLDTPTRLGRRLTAWSFLAPSLLHLTLFTAGPLLFAGWLSVHSWSLVEEARPFVGIDNYVRAATNTDFWNAVGNTAVFTLHVPVAMAVALALALLLHGRGRTAPVLRGLLFLPTVTSLVALAVVWQWMFNEEYGLLNWILSWVGLGPVPWLTSPATALPSLMLMTVWLVVGYQVILFQAGLTAIPQHLYDAARIDGANAWQRFRHVTWPGLRPTLFFVLVTSIIGSFQVFGTVYVMTEGGPLRSTDVAVFHIYEEAWEFLRFGDAAAMSWIVFAIIFGVTWLHFRTLERRTVDG